MSSTSTAADLLVTVSQDLIAVGRIGPARGVRGDAFVEPWTDAPDERFAAGSVLRTDPSDAGPLTVERVNLSGAKMVLHFAGFDTREAVEALRGVRLVVAAEDRPAIEDPDEFYASDLVGCAARTVSGVELGPVADVLDIAGADYLVLHVDGVERLVPFVREVVPEVDLTTRVVTVDPPEGLFDL
ncbi:ribosome maturation factor RimM [uncultured Jatrophihabitans sp.]|uniref:ribosome maturation factor RimM n=1 Tax=uncultured Jatrophihabitans sp. TaxID=1610747 RepID=UPI0035CB96CF